MSEETDKIIKKGEFVEVSFIGRITDSGEVFDTTEETVAKEHGLTYRPNELGRKTICVGESHILAGLDDEIIKMPINQKKTIKLDPSKAFGKKDASLIKLIPTNKFRSEKINPEPGMQVQIDGIMGVVKTVSGARTLVDLNNPLAGKPVEYELTITKRVTDLSKQAEWVIRNEFGFVPVIEKKENTQDQFILKMNGPVPDEIKKTVTDRIRKLIPKISDFTVEDSKKTPEK